MSKETGGPAFPIWHETSVCASGMSIRDHFAGLAMQGILVNAGCYSACGVAKEAYEMADAMLEARKK
ncbi:hypothetical protein [Serratia sp. N21D137]|uniref:hypothetical protein n=1 Tax=Serratia sp. N21D137 TaxID=3397495 RepID=UPI0039E0AE72